MALAVNAGARLDRLPVSSFYYRIFWLVGGDKMGRRFTYQINLLIFGLASLAAAFAQDMNQLIACRFLQGLGLGAEIVVGYSTLTEFVPPRTRGRWLSMMAFLVVAGFPATALLGWLIIPAS